MKTLTDLVHSLLSESSSPTSLLALAGSLVFGILLLVAQSDRRKHKLAKEPHRLPSTSLVYGDQASYNANSHRLHDWMAETSAGFGGEPWVIRTPRQKDAVIVSLPEHMDDVLNRQFDKFPRGEFQSSYFEPLFGTSLVNSDGKRWYHQRKVAANFFTARSLRSCMITSMHKNVIQVNGVIDAAIAEKTSVDLIKLLHEFTLQTFVEVGLGLEVKWIGTNDSNPVDSALAVASVATMRRFRVPEFYWKLQRLLGLGPEKDLAATMGSLRQWMRDVIKDSLEAVQERKSKSDPNATEIKSMLELFVEQSQDDTEGMGPDDLVDFILIFVLAAQDTSAVSLSWFFLMMSKHPEVEEKIRMEMAAILPDMDVKPETYLTTGHVQKLVYLEATIKEVLRLYPAIPLFFRECAEDTVIGKGVSIRKGQMINISPFAMARSTKVWGPDAAEFKPERWIDPTSGELKVVPSTTFSTFSTGPRICIGMKLATLELRVVTANLLHRYRFELAQPNDASYRSMIALVLKNPLVVKAERVVAN